MWLNYGQGIAVGNVYIKSACRMRCRPNLGFAVAIPRTIANKYRLSVHRVGLLLDQTNLRTGQVLPGTSLVIKKVEELRFPDVKNAPPQIINVSNCQDDFYLPQEELSARIGERVAKLIYVDEPQAGPFEFLYGVDLESLDQVFLELRFRPPAVDPPPEDMPDQEAPKTACQRAQTLFNHPYTDAATASPAMVTIMKPKRRRLPKAYKQFKSACTQRPYNWQKAFIYLAKLLKYFREQPEALGESSNFNKFVKLAGHFQSLKSADKLAPAQLWELAVYLYKLTPPLDGATLRQNLEINTRLMMAGQMDDHLYRDGNIGYQQDIRPLSSGQHLEILPVLAAVRDQLNDIYKQARDKETSTRSTCKNIKAELSSLYNFTRSNALALLGEQIAKLIDHNFEKRY